jgi:hypothetical protein
MYLYGQILDAIATHQVADRPDRFEPRRRKRRPKPYDRLMKPRHEAKRDILKGYTENQVPFVRHTGETTNSFAKLATLDQVAHSSRIQMEVRLRERDREVGMERFQPKPLMRACLVVPGNGSSIAKQDFKVVYR